MNKRYNIFDFFLDGIFVIDESKNIVYANQLAATLFGLRIKRLIGKPCYDHFQFKDGTLFCMPDGTVGKDSPSKYVEVDFSSPKGAEGTVQVMVQPDKGNEEGQFWIVYFHDVTDEKRISSKYKTETEEKEKAQNLIFKIKDDLKEFENMALTDDMTGLPNFRSFQNNIVEELNNCLKTNSPMGMVILDVDKFKVFNDTYGHQQGDEVLRYVAKALTSAVRKTDKVARYGGEEFVMILPDTNKEGVKIACEKVREAIESTQVPYLAKDGEVLSVTSSFGGVCIEPGKLKESGVTDFKVFVECADKNLYEAKENGRNCSVVSLWDPDAPEGDKSVDGGDEPPPLPV
ncbi:MAG: diguanylate cyclase [Deltaproteobacteria bacterium]|nr:MAG: diguanylate cyclase [Deltaproteobacteria bacterium]